MLSSRPFGIRTITVFMAVLAGACGGNDAPAARSQPFTADPLVEALYRELQPVVVEPCELQRFGEPDDGGYLLCGDLLHDVRSAYSYGISGYDGWGCDVSRQLAVPVHQYDCFDTRRTSCDGGTMIFHEECLGARALTDDGRLFDTLQQQIARNADAGKRLLVKMDIEGAEWDSLLAAPAEVLDLIDQLAIEFHGVGEHRQVAAVQRLKDFFHVVHLHFNNYSCSGGIAPFPAFAYEVLFVHKRLAHVRDTSPPARPHPLDAPNNPAGPDCQVLTASDGPR